MASDVKLYLKEEYLKTGAIWLEAEGYTATDRADIEPLDRDKDDSLLMISVFRDNGEPLLFVIENFKEETEYAIKTLRDQPLPWTFSLELLKLKEKPLEDILLAVYKKFKSTKFEWE